MIDIRSNKMIHPPRLNVGGLESWLRKYQESLVKIINTRLSSKLKQRKIKHNIIKIQNAFPN